MLNTRPEGLYHTEPAAHTSQLGTVGADCPARQCCGVSTFVHGFGESRESTFVQRERGGGANLGMRAPRFANHC